MTEKKKPDYTNSAVNLCNPPEIETLLTDLARLKYREATIKAELYQTQLYTELEARQRDITACQQSIREAIETQGSYQDLDAGYYAIKQKKVSVTYIASKVREFLPLFADAVIEEVVNKYRIEQLLKSSLISGDKLLRCAETTETFSFIIRAEEGK